MSQELLWWGPMWYFPLLMPGLMLIMAFFAIYVLFGRGRQFPWEEGRERPLDILKKRYAQGEISKEEFAEMKRDIMA